MVRGIDCGSAGALVVCQRDLAGLRSSRMAHMSNRERIARAAEEARLQEADKADKAAKKASKPAPRVRSKSAAKAVRMKIIWEVCNAAGTVVKTFAYPDKAAAESATLELTKSSGRAHVLRAGKVPME